MMCSSPPELVHYLKDREVTKVTDDVSPPELFPEVIVTRTKRKKQCNVPPPLKRRRVQKDSPRNLRFSQKLKRKFNPSVNSCPPSIEKYSSAPCFENQYNSAPSNENSQDLNYTVECSDSTDSFSHMPLLIAGDEELLPASEECSRSSSKMSAVKKIDSIQSDEGSIQCNSPTASQKHTPLELLCMEEQSRENFCEDREEKSQNSIIETRMSGDDTVSGISPSSEDSGTTCIEQKPIVEEEGAHSDFASEDQDLLCSDLDDMWSDVEPFFQVAQQVSTGKEERDTIDGYEFLSFETEHDMVEFTKIELDFKGITLNDENYLQCDNAVDTTYDGISENDSQEPSQAIVPTKTKDITKIKGWRTKQFLVSNNPTHANTSSSCSSAYDWEDKYGSSILRSGVKELDKEQKLLGVVKDENVEKSTCSKTFNVHATSPNCAGYSGGSSSSTKTTQVSGKIENKTLDEMSVDSLEIKETSDQLGEKSVTEDLFGDQDIFRPFDDESLEISQDCEKSAFISDVLENFLTTQAELKISFEVPSLAAETAISKSKEEECANKRLSFSDSLSFKERNALSPTISEENNRQIDVKHIKKEKKFNFEAKFKSETADSDSRSTVDGQLYFRSSDTKERGIDGADSSEADEGERGLRRRRQRRLRPREIPNYNEESLDSDSEEESLRKQPHRKSKKTNSLRSSRHSARDIRVTTSESERDATCDSASSKTEIYKNTHKTVRSCSATRKASTPLMFNNLEKNLKTVEANNKNNNNNVPTHDISFSFNVGIGKQLPAPVISQLHIIRSDNYQIDENWAEFATSVVLPTQWNGKTLPKQRVILPARKSHFVFEELHVPNENHNSAENTKCVVPKPELKSNASKRKRTISEKTIKMSPKKLTLLNSTKRLQINNRSTSPDPDCIIIEEFNKKEQDKHSESKFLCKNQFKFESTSIHNVCPNRIVAKEVHEVVNNLVGYVLNKERGDRVKNDPDSTYGDAAAFSHSTVEAIESNERRSEINILNKKKKSINLVREMERLGVNVIEMNVNQNDVCKEDFCKLGCVCKSLQTCKSLPQTHCGEVECMFSCKCESGSNFYKDESINNRLSSSDMLIGLQKYAGRHLAKKEREFQQTVIKGEEGVIVVGGDGNVRRKRDRKLPKRYNDSVFISDLTIPQIKALAAKSDDDKLKNTRNKSDVAEIKMSSLKDEKTAQEKTSSEKPPSEKVRGEKAPANKLNVPKSAPEKLGVLQKVPISSPPAIIQLLGGGPNTIKQESHNPVHINSSGSNLELGKITKQNNLVSFPQRPFNKSVITYNSKPEIITENGTVFIRSQSNNVHLKDVEITKVASEEGLSSAAPVQELHNDVEIKVISSSSPTLSSATQRLSQPETTTKVLPNDETLTNTAVDQESRIIENQHDALRKRLGIDQCFVSINKVRGIKKRPYCMDHEEYGCECIKKRIPPNPLCDLIKLNTAIKRLCSPPLTVEQRRQMVEDATEVQRPSRNVAIKHTTQIGGIHIHNLQTDSARTAGISRTYLARRLSRSVIRNTQKEKEYYENISSTSPVGGDKQTRAGIKIAAVTTLTLEEFSGQKGDDPVHCSDIGTQQRPSVIDSFTVDTQHIQPKTDHCPNKQLDSQIFKLLQGSNSENLKTMINEGNSFPDLSKLPKGCVQVVNWNFLKKLFEMNDVFVWLRVFDSGMKIVITATNRQPTPQFTNLKKMRKLQGFPAVVQNLVNPGDNENYKYAILKCDGTSWQIAGTVTNKVKNSRGEQSDIRTDIESEQCNEVLQSSEIENSMPVASTSSPNDISSDRPHDGSPFAELRSKISPARFKAKMLELLAAGELSNSEMRFEIANVTVVEETYSVSQGLYTLPRGSLKFRWFSVPLVKKYDMVYVASKRCGIEYEDMLDMVFKSMRDKVALCKPLLEKREGFVLVNDLSCPKFGVYATFEAPQKLLFGPFTLTEQPRITVHRLVVPPNPGPSQSAGSIIHSSLQKSVRSHIINRPKKVPCVLCPMLPNLGFITAMRLHTGEITFRHFFIKDQELMFPNMDAVDTWLDKFLQSRILYVPKQLRVKWNCVLLESFDPSGKKSFDNHILNGNHVMTIMGVFDLYEMKSNNAPSYGLKTSLLHKLKEKLRRRDILEAFNGVSRVLFYGGCSRLSKLLLLNKAIEEIKQLEADFKKLSAEKAELKERKQTLLKRLYDDVTRMSYKKDVENIVSDMKKVWEKNESPPVVQISEDGDDSKENLCNLPLFLSGNTEGSADKIGGKEAVIDIASSDSDVDDYLSDEQITPDSEQTEDNLYSKDNDHTSINVADRLQLNYMSSYDENSAKMTSNISQRLCNVQHISRMAQNPGRSDWSTFTINHLKKQTENSFIKIAPRTLVNRQTKDIEVINISDDEESNGNENSVELAIPEATNMQQEWTSRLQAEEQILIPTNLGTNQLINTFDFGGNQQENIYTPSVIMETIPCNTSTGNTLSDAIYPPSVPSVSSQDVSLGQGVFKIGGKLYVRSKTGEAIPVVAGQWGRAGPPIVQVPENVTEEPPLYETVYMQPEEQSLTGHVDEFVPACDMASPVITSVSSWHVPFDPQLASGNSDSSALSQKSDNLTLSPLPVSYNTPSNCETSPIRSGVIMSVGSSPKNILSHHHVAESKTLSPQKVQISIPVITQVRSTKDTSFFTTGESHFQNNN